MPCLRQMDAQPQHPLERHGLDADTYKELYDLNRTASLWPPILQAKQRELALARDQGAVLQANRCETATCPKGLSARLSTRIKASKQRKGIYTRGGKRTK
jgi:hypothetical protein